MSAKKNNPTRTCVGCGQKRPAHELQRFVADTGQLHWSGPTIPSVIEAKLIERDLSAAPKGAGRGAWVCGDNLIDCFDLATSRRRWGRALRTKLDYASVQSLRDCLE